jgi:hypothetical protein
VTVRATPAAAGSARPPSTAGRLADLSSYRYTVRIDGVGGPAAGLFAEISAPLGSPTPIAGQAVTLDVTGAYVKPDRATTTWRFSGNALTLTFIGRDRWAQFGTIITGPTPGNRTPNDMSLAGQAWDAAFSPMLSRLSCADAREIVNGMSTRRCTSRDTGATALNPVFEQFGAGPAGIRSVTSALTDVWLTDGAYPARLRSEISGLDGQGREFRLRIEIDVTDVNGQITVAAPR